MNMARPTKMTLDITKRIGDNISLGLPYSLATESAGITYQTFNEWLKKGRNSTSREHFKFSQHIQKCNVDAAKALLERLNDATKGRNCQVCMWILDRRFPDDFGRRVYRKINSVSDNKNENVQLIVNDSDEIRKQILAKFDRVEESNELLTS